MHRRRTLLALLAAFALSGPAIHADIIRESTGQHRADLDKMELKAFPADAWGKLTGWTNGDALSATAVDGKPVLIVMWASWHPASQRALPLAQRMAEKFGPQGLIVVGAHHQLGWAEAPQAAKDKGATFRLAHDEKGEFRSALLSKTEPTFYLVDRSGNMRYAAVSAASVEEACTELVGETVAQAGDIPTILKKRAEEAAATGRKTTEIRPQLDLASLPAVPPGYLAPGEAAYKSAKWPNITGERYKDYGLVDSNGQPVEPKLAFTPAGFYPSRPETQGRAIVIYLWHPDVVASYQTAMPQMDLLQQQYTRDLAVIGAVVPMRTLTGDQSGQSGQEEEQPDKLTQRYMQMARSRTFRHALAADVAGSALASLSGGGGQFGTGSTKFPLPGAMIVSTDGTIRWVGPTTGSDFKYAIDTILANDPGIRARRAADQAYIEGRKR